MRILADFPFDDNVYMRTKQRENGTGLSLVTPSGPSGLVSARIRNLRIDTDFFSICRL